jgi:ABC-2 type transport system ATP-binding protein
LEVKGLCRDFGSRRAIENLEFSLAAGEILGLVGPSGAGKTVTLRILSGALEGSSGTASICGISVAAGNRKIYELFGAVAENHPLPEQLSPFEYLQLRACLKKVRDRRREVTRALQICGLLRFGKRHRIGQLSRGHRQLVALADAILGRPALILLDGLEPWQLRLTLEERAGRPAALVTGRGVAELAGICSKIIFLDRGRIVGDRGKERSD